MSHELFYTSAPRGLQPGSGGFCTVAATRGIPPLLAEKLEGLSGYRPLFGPVDANAARNPILCAHLVMPLQGRAWHVLSRVCASGLDHTQRTNKFAHHVALESGELTETGPAWLLLQPGFMETTWDGQVRQIAGGRRPPRGDLAVGPCRAWQDWTGDAGWAGVLAEAFEADPQRPVYLLYPAGRDPLPLVAEALALLPPERRWQVSFSTYFTSLPPGIGCAWRCVPSEAPEAGAASRAPGSLVLDLGRYLGPAAGDGLVDQARTGRPSARVGVRQPAPLPAPAAPSPAYTPAAPAFNAPAAHNPRSEKPFVPAPPQPPASPRVVVREADERGSSAGVLMLGVLLGLLLAGGAGTVVYAAALAPQLSRLREANATLEASSARLGDELKASKREADVKDELIGKLTRENDGLKKLQAKGGVDSDLAHRQEIKRKDEKIDELQVELRKEKADRRAEVETHKEHARGLQAKLDARGDGEEKWEAFIKALAKHPVTRGWVENVVLPAMKEKRPDLREVFDKFANELLVSADELFAVRNYARGNADVVDAAQKPDRERSEKDKQVLRDKYQPLKNYVRNFVKVRDSWVYEAYWKRWEEAADKYKDYKPSGKKDK